MLGIKLSNKRNAKPQENNDKKVLASKQISKKITLL